MTKSVSPPKRKLSPPKIPLSPFWFPYFSGGVGFYKSRLSLLPFRPEKKGGGSLFYFALPHASVVPLSKKELKEKRGLPSHAQFLWIV